MSLNFCGRGRPRAALPVARREVRSNPRRRRQGRNSDAPTTSLQTFKSNKLLPPSDLPRLVDGAEQREERERRTFAGAGTASLRLSTELLRVSGFERPCPSGRSRSDQPTFGSKRTAAVEYQNFRLTILHLTTEIKRFSRLSAKKYTQNCVTHRCRASACRRPRGQSPACKRRCAYQPDASRRTWPRPGNWRPLRPEGVR
jgi:hypothetical protein